ncbi:hypothetical protein FNAPI_5849 [Fusarium napiforme]|uniref:BZIP transcription factor n=1 Tax=Fusarium napiforme TaxID=42672 RepID=A0A8H5N8W6_9HYPO|nr:hypothetical protein FNAPI_5849 [Fusarium napiforme]
MLAEKPCPKQEIGLRVMTRPYPGYPFPAFPRVSPGFVHSTLLYSVTSLCPSVSRLGYPLKDDRRLRVIILHSTLRLLLSFWNKIQVMPPKKSTGVSKSGTSWKEKLTDQQLERKRAADRQMVRESRIKSRQTIALLEERLALLVDKQHDKLIQDLLRSNNSLEQERDALRHRLLAVGGALGLDRDQNLELMQDIVPLDNNHAQKPSSPMVTNDVQHQLEEQPHQTTDGGHDMEVVNEPFELQDELDARMFESGFPSPWPEIYKAMGCEPGKVNLDTNLFLQAVILWRSRSTITKGTDTLGLASVLFHVNRPPVNLTREKLDRLASAPGILQSLVRDLEDIEPFVESRVQVQGPVEARTTISHTKRELAICAFMAISPWNYISKESRLAMFWGLYRILTVLVFPTPNHLASCPTWYWPVPSQMFEPHPSFIDFIPWPGVRAHLIGNWEKYRGKRLYSSFVRNIQVGAPILPNSETLVRLSSNEMDLELQPEAEAWFRNLKCLRTQPQFLSDFSEFAPYIQLDQPDPCLDSHLSYEPLSLVAEARSDESTSQCLQVSSTFIDVDMFGDQLFSAAFDSPSTSLESLDLDYLFPLTTNMNSGQLANGLLPDTNNHGHPVVEVTDTSSTQRGILSPLDMPTSYLDDILADVSIFASHYTHSPEDGRRDYTSGWLKTRYELDPSLNDHEPSCSVPSPDRISLPVPPFAG